jgi:hypothetical protein
MLCNCQTLCLNFPLSLPLTVIDISRTLCIIVKKFAYLFSLKFDEIVERVLLHWLLGHGFNWSLDLAIVERVLYSPIHWKLQFVGSFVFDNKCLFIYTWLNHHVLLFAKAPVFEMSDAQIE